MSFYMQNLIQCLLAGTIDSARLESELATVRKGAWANALNSGHVRLLLNNPTALGVAFGSSTALAQLLALVGPEIAASDPATKTLCETPTGIYAVVTNTSYLNLWQLVSANKARMQARINATGSKLCRVEYTAAGTYTFTVPAGGILARSAALAGGGGPGGARAAGKGGRGGSGAEFKTEHWDTSLSAGSTLAIVIGASGQDSSIGALTATRGNTGSNGAGTTAGPGTTTGTVYETDISNQIWQPNSATVQGADGGGGAPAGINPGQAGTAGITGSGGSAGNSSGSGGGKGSGLCSGGGGGGAGGAGSSGTNGETATAPGCGGGGAGDGDMATGNPGSGGPGKCVLSYIKAA